MRQYIIDILLFIVFIILAFVFAGKPALSYKTGIEERAVSTRKEVRGELKNEIKAPDYKNLEKRNIFASDGSYVEKGLIQLPENPYNLIAILQGKEKRAVFREYTGSIVSLKVNDKLIDGAVITHIDRLYVITKKGKVTKEYKIFDVKPNVK